MLLKIKTLPIITIHNSDTLPEQFKRYIDIWKDKLEDGHLFIVNLTDIAPSIFLETIDKHMKESGFTNEQRKNTTYIEMVDNAQDITYNLHYIFYNFILKNKMLSRTYTHVLWYDDESILSDIYDLIIDAQEAMDNTEHQLLMKGNSDHLAMFNLPLVINTFVENLKEQELKACLNDQM